MDNSLPIKSSSVSGTETVTATWPWACLLGQPQAWLWGLCSGSSRAFKFFCALLLLVLCAIIDLQGISVCDKCLL